jgi:aspartate/methionine/tyrosine aminotransferase
LEHTTGGATQRPLGRPPAAAAAGDGAAAAAAAAANARSTQLSEFVQRQLGADVIDLAAGQVCCVLCVGVVVGCGGCSLQANEKNTTQNLLHSPLAAKNRKQPGPGSLPLDLIAQAAAHRLSAPGVADPLLLQYGAERGYKSFRAALAGFLREHAGSSVTADELMVTAGA